MKPRPQLGPSHEFHENAKLAEKFEKEAAKISSEPAPAATTKAGKPRRARPSRLGGVGPPPN